MDSEIPQYLRPIKLSKTEPPAPRQQGAEKISARSLALCSLPEARRYLDEEHAQRLIALPLGIVDILGTKTLTVAVGQGRKVEIERALRFAIELPVRVAEVPSEVLAEAISIAYCGDEGRLMAGVQKLRAVESHTSQRALTQPIDFRPPTGEVSQFVASLVEFGFSKGASDIHLLPRREGTYVRMRVQGELLSNSEPLCTAAVHQQVVARIKVLAGVGYSQGTIPCDGSFGVPFAGREARVRVSTIPTLYGEKVVLRLLGAVGAASLHDLGFDAAVLAALSRAAQRPQGAIYVAGPTGSGKSSTLYALAARVAAQGRSVCSVEDPVERVLSDISQTQIDEPRGLTFPLGLRAVVRQDPDVIMVGEIRDSESAQIALQAALTGHLLLSSVHAGTIPGIVKRLRSLGVEDDLLAETAPLFINQRLIPTLCSRCKVVDLPASRGAPSARFKAVGCSICDYSGFSGRVPIAQIWAPGCGEIRNLQEENWLATRPGWIGWGEQIKALLALGAVALESVSGYIPPE